jgi:hypothetical protein
MKAAVGRLALWMASLLVPVATAHAEPAGDPLSRAELFATVGIAAPVDPNHIRNVDGWVTSQLGCGYRMGRSLSLGALFGMDWLPEQDITYFPEGSDFLSARVSAVMIPMCAYLSARLPSSDPGRLYVTAQAGAYVLRSSADRPDAPEPQGTEPMFGVAIGISGDEQSMAPRIELGYELRSLPPGGLLPQGWMQMLRLSVGLRAQTLQRSHRCPRLARVAGTGIHTPACSPHSATEPLRARRQLMAETHRATR